MYVTATKCKNVSIYVLTVNCSVYEDSRGVGGIICATVCFGNIVGCEYGVY